MKNPSTHTGKLEIMERLKNSYNGNPRFRCYIAGVSFVTKPDCMYGYRIENYQGRELTVVLATHYNKTTLMQIKAI